MKERRIMSSRKNAYGPDAFEYLVETNQDMQTLRKQIEELDKTIEDLEDQVDKLNKINETLRQEVMKAHGLTDGI
jgi:chromosome segregation ATPase